MPVAARPMVALALEQLQAMLTSASLKQHGTRDCDTAAVLAQGMSAQCGPYRDPSRAFSCSLRLRCIMLRYAVSDMS